jgi:hypothetical protein
MYRYVRREGMRGEVGKGIEVGRKENNKKNNNYICERRLYFINKK